MVVYRRMYSSDSGASREGQGCQTREGDGALMCEAEVLQVTQDHAVRDTHIAPLDQSSRAAPQSSAGSSCPGPLQREPPSSVLTHSMEDAEPPQLEGRATADAAPDASTTTTAQHGMPQHAAELQQLEQHQEQEEHHQQHQQEQPCPDASTPDSPSSSSWCRAEALHGEPSVLVPVATAACNVSSPGPTAAGKPTYAQLQLRCQMLESALEQQQQSSEAALCKALASAAAEDASLRVYYEAQLCDLLDRLGEAHEQLGAAAGEPGAAEGSHQGGGHGSGAAPASPLLLSLSQQPSRPGSAPARGAAAAAGGNGSAAVRPASPSVSLRRSLQASLATAAANLTEPGALRRELASVEALLAASQEEGRAAGKRIKDLEAQLSSTRAALAEESSRAQRAVAAAAAAEATGGAPAAHRLGRILQLEGALQEMQVSWREREALLLSQLDAARQQRSEAEGRAAAAAAAAAAEHEAPDELVVRQAAAIAALEQQLVAVTATAAGSGSSQPDEALTAAQERAHVLQQQLLATEAAHAEQLGQLQQQHQAMKQQLAAASSSKGRVRELWQQLEEQRESANRRIRALETKLAAAQAAALSAGGSSGYCSRRSSAAGGAGGGSRRSSQQHTAVHQPQQPQPAGTDEEPHAAAAAGNNAEAAGAGAASGQQQQRMLASLAAKDRQLSGLTAQLDERTTQVLQLQQKVRQLERQLKTAGSTKQQRGAGGRRSASPLSPAAAAAPAGAGGPAAPGAWPLEGAAAASWPGLCAELEAEAERLKGALAAAADREQQLRSALAAADSRLAAALPVAAAGGHGGDAAAAVLPGGLHQLLAVAEEVSGREADKWRARLAATEQALADAQHEVAALRSELSVARARGAWSPGAATLDALERKIAALEAAAAAQQQQQPQQQSSLLQQQYEHLLAVKNAELESFRQQVDALLAAATRLHQSRMVAT